MKEKVIVKIIYPDKVEEFDVSEGYTLLFTPDGCGVIEHGFVYDGVSRAAFAAQALASLPEEHFELAIAYAEELRDARKAANKTKFVGIRGGQS